MMESEELEWDIYALSRYVEICFQSWPGDNFVIGNPETGMTLHREGHSNFNEGEVGNEDLQVSRFVQSFKHDDAVELHKKFITVDPKLKVYHNFYWYKERLEFLEKMELSA